MEAKCSCVAATLMLELTSNDGLLKTIHFGKERRLGVILIPKLRSRAIDSSLLSIVRTPVRRSRNGILRHFGSKPIQNMTRSVSIGVGARKRIELDSGGCVEGGMG